MFVAYYLVIAAKRSPDAKQLPFIMSYLNYYKLYKTYKRPGHERLSAYAKEQLARQRDEAVESKRSQ